MHCTKVTHRNFTAIFHIIITFVHYNVQCIYSILYHQTGPVLSAWDNIDISLAENITSS